MSKTKILITISLAVMMVVGLLGIASPAAALSQPVTGTIQSITVYTNTDTVPDPDVTTLIVVVTILDTANVTRTIRLSVENAITLGLVTVPPGSLPPYVDPTLVTVDATKIGTSITIDPSQELPAGPIYGTIQNIAIGTYGPMNMPIVLVTLVDANLQTITIRLSVEEAVLLGLVTLDPVTGLPVVDITKYGTPLVVDATKEIAPEPITAGDNKLGSALATFFWVDYSTVMGYREDGYGFGVIAQALWMANSLGDNTLADEILAAKKSGDYSAIVLEDGSTPTNWGQFRKAVLGHGGKKNLGQIVSGQDASPYDQDAPVIHGKSADHRNNTDKNNNGHNK